MPKTLLVIDGHALIYRAYYAFPPTLINQEGMLVNAAYGFAKILLTAIRNFNPDCIVLTFDSKEQTVRQKEFPYYKANREPMPEDLRPQVEIIKRFVTALNIPQYEIPGEEADDIIGTISCQAAAQAASGEQPDLLTVIVTGDRDTFQLVNDHVHVYLPARGKDEPEELDAAAVKQRMGVRPDQIADYKALAGDSSDNIPGVSGVGAKTAVNLLQTFETLDQVYATIDAEQLQPGDQSANYPLLKGALLNKLIRDRQQAYDSRKLGTIKCDEVIDFDLDRCQVANYDKAAAVEILEELDFPSLIKLLPVDQFEQGLQDALF